MLPFIWPSASDHDPALGNRASLDQQTNVLERDLLRAWRQRLNMRIDSSSHRPTPLLANVAASASDEPASTTQADPLTRSQGESAHRSELRKRAEQLVSQTFFGTLLKQMRDSPFKSEMFSGGRGGQAFNQLFDQQIADRISKDAGGKLVDSLIRQWEKPTHAQPLPNTRQFRLPVDLSNPKVIDHASTDYSA